MDLRQCWGCSHLGCSSPTVPLQIVPLLVNTPKGDSEHTYALLDACIQASLVLEKFAAEVGLEGPKKVPTLGAINSKEESKPTRKVPFFVKTVSDDNAMTSILIPEDWTVPRLNLSKQRITRSVMHVDQASCSQPKDTRS